MDQDGSIQTNSTFVDVVEVWHMLETDISLIVKNSIQSLQDEMISLKKTSNLTMKEYILKFKALKYSLEVVEYGLQDDR